MGTLLSAISIYLIPLAICLISLFAFITWDDRDDNEPSTPLAMQVLLTSDATLGPENAQHLLSRQPARMHFETRLSEQAVWFAFRLPAGGGASAVELPSRHATDLACWDSTSLRPLGYVKGRQQASVQLAPLKSGYVLHIERGETDVICRAHFVGPARLNLQAWTQDRLNASALAYHRRSGLFDGSMLVLTAFVLVTGLINRQRLYLIFGVWLFVGLRVGATSGGWDTQWLDQTIPSEWLPKLRSVTLAAYALLTLALYRTMFREDLQRTGYALALELAHALCLPLLVMSLALPRSAFIPTMWLFAAPGLILMMMSLLTIIVRTRSHAAILYGSSLAVTFLSSFSEILAAAFGFNGLLGTFNSVTAAIASSFLAAVAIAEQMRQEHKQRLAVQAELQHTYDVMPIGLFTLDLQGNFLSANPAMHKMLRRHVLRRGRSAWWQHFDHASWNTLETLLAQQAEVALEVDGPDLGQSDKQRRYLVKAARVQHKIEGSLQDVTAQSRANAELSFLANHDSLTKVLNRRGIEAEYAQAVQAMEGQQPLAMAYLDLDRFKLINDLYGHNTGDDILRQVCQRVLGLLSGSMRMGRIGGDEFVILLPDTKMTLATVICRGIVDCIDDAAYRVGDKAFHVRGSIGLIEVSPGTRIKDALSTADRACRDAKLDPHKRLVVYELDAPVFRAHQAEIQLVERLSGSDALEGLFIEMQPIMSLTRPYDSLNFEVLLRMHDRNGARVPPTRLIAAAEHSGRMGMIDRWVLATTLAWLDRHRARLQKTQFVCINLSGSSLNDETFMQEAFEMLQGNSHVVDFLSIEITESVALHDLSNTRRFIEQVRSYGARVALDDFGAGYTSFAYLKELPADLLKIDGSFIVNMNQHPANVAIVEAIVNLAGNLGMKTVAEWAEDAATVETLSEIGVDYVQGFVVAQPQAPDNLLLANSSASFVQDATLAQWLQQLSPTTLAARKAAVQVGPIDPRRRDIH